MNCTEALVFSNGPDKVHFRCAGEQLCKVTSMRSVDQPLSVGYACRSTDGPEFATLQCEELRGTWTVRELSSRDGLIAHLR